MAQLLLQLVHRQTVFQLMRGIGMAQAMDTTNLLNAGLVFSLFKCFLRGRMTQVMTRRIAIGKEP